MQKHHFTNTCSRGVCAIMCLLLSIPSAYSQKMPGDLKYDGYQHTMSLMAVNALDITGIFSTGIEKPDGPINGSMAYRFVDEASADYSIRLSANQKKCVNVDKNNSQNGTNIYLWDCDGGAYQQWVFTNNSIRSKWGSNKCLDLSKNNTQNGTNIQLWDCNNSNAQRWIYDGLSRQIRNGGNWNKCLVRENASDGNGNIKIWDCEDNPNQQWEIPVAAGSVEGINRVKTIHLAKDNSKCLDLYNATTANKTNIQLWDCHGKDAQKWLFDGINIRYYAQQNKCVELYKNNTANGTNIQLYDCRDTDAQRWTYDGVTGAVRYWRNPNKCLVAKGGSTARGTNIEIRDCNGSVEQRWALKDADTPYGADKAKTIYLVKNTNKCVAVSGSNIELWWHYDGNTGQQWTYDGLYLKRNYKEGDSDQCLKLDRGDTHKGTNIMLSTCVGSKAQRWLYDKKAQAIRYADNWNKCLDLDHGNTNDGTNIWIYDCNGSDAQKWIME